MHKSPIEDIYNNQKFFIFNQSKADPFLKDLRNELNLLLNKESIENLHHNFTTTLSTSLNKFSIEVTCKKENRVINPWYDKE